MKLRESLHKLFAFLNGLTSKGFFHLLISNILIALSLFGAQILVAKWITPAELGLIKSWQAYIAILSVFAGLGLVAPVLKISANRDKEDITSYFFTSLVVLIIGAILVWLFFLLLLNNGVFTDNEELLLYLNEYSFIIVLTATNALFLAHYTGQRKIKEVSKINTFYRLVSVCFIMLLTYKWGIEGFFFSLIMGVSLTLLVYFFLNRKELTFDLFSLQVLRRYPTLDYSFHGGILCNGISQLALGLDLLLLNYFAADAEMIGYYSFALLVVMGLSMFTGTIMQIVTPYITLNENELLILKKKYYYYQKIALLSYFIIFIIVLFITPPVIDWIFSGKYKQTEPFYLPVFLFWLLRSFSAMPLALFSGVGEMRVIANGNFFSLCISFFAYYVGYKYFGMMGMAYALIIPPFIYMFYNQHYVNKVFGKATP